jgi:hypothetical protein
MERYALVSMAFPFSFRSRYPLVGIGVLIGFAFTMSNFLSISWVYFVWLIKSPILQLFDLKSEEEHQLTHHGHLKSLCHDPTKLFIKLMVSTTKYYVIDIYLAHKYIFIDFPSKEGKISCAYFKALLEKNSLRHSYHALGAWLSP